MQTYTKEKRRCGRAEEILSKRYAVDDRYAVCRLLKTDAEPSAFAVRIEFEGEVGEAYLGESVARAAQIFEILVCGRVTPCTMCDIIADYEE